MTIARLCFALALLVIAGPVGASVLLVPGDHASIQEAVDAAATSGDEIIVSAGTYVEQVIISKNLTLTGAGVGQTVLQAPLFMPHTAHTLAYNAVIHVEQPATAVTLRHFTVEGSGRGQPGTRFTGIMYDGVGGLTEHVEIQGIHDTPVTAAVSGIGFYAYSGATENNVLVVDDLSIHEFQKTGVAVFGSGAFYDLRNVVVDASGLYSDAVQNGLELQNGSTGSLTNCTVRSCWYDGAPDATATSVGIFFYYCESWTITGGLADENQTNVYVIDTDMEIQGFDSYSYPTALEYNNGMTLTTAASAGAKARRSGEPRPLESVVHIASDLFLMKVDISDCDIMGTNIIGSAGLACFSSNAELAVDIQNCHVADWDVGLLFLEDIGGFVSARARSCQITGNNEFGAIANTVIPVDARGNQWGDASGPFHPVTNPSGLGQEVSDQIVYDPWLQGNIVFAPLLQYISLEDDDGAGYSDVFTMRYFGGGNKPLYGFSIELKWAPGLITAASVDVAQPLQGAFSQATFFQVVPVTDGMRVDAALGGNQAGIDDGELFSIRLHLVGAPDYTEIPVEVEIHHLRDNSNEEVLGCTANDGIIAADLQGPAFSSLKLINITLPHTDDYAKNGDELSVDASVTDGDPLFGVGDVVGSFVFIYGGGGYSLKADTYTAGHAVWLPRPAVLAPADGPVYTTSVTATDPAGNVSIMDLSVIADNTPPLPMSGFSAVAGHNQVELQWDDPVGLDANLRHVVVRGQPWGDYPTYEGAEPEYPATPTDGVPVHAGLDVLATATYPADGSGRDIIYYQAFAVDMVDLSSPVTAGARARSTNYRLADVTGNNGGTYEGLTNIYDLSLLGDAFGRVTGQADFDAECDVGPTDDFSADGIPEPNGAIDFDDLFIFSDQWDRYLHPAKVQPPRQPVAAPKLRWTHKQPLVWILELEAPCPGLKAVRLSGGLSDDVPITVMAGALLSAQSAPHFLHGEDKGIEVSLAVLGYGVGIKGAGELLRIETAYPVKGLNPDIDARSVTNERLASHLKAAAPVPGAGDHPLRFAAHGNYPNPFNPATAIAFDLPSPQPVRLVVYSIDGRRVAVVQDGALPAGHHELIWRGRDTAGRPVSAGTYIYRLQAGPWAARGKLDLLK